MCSRFTLFFQVLVALTVWVPNVAKAQQQQQLMTVVPIQSTFAVTITGEQWQRVAYHLSELEDPSVSIEASVTRLLSSALSPMPHTAAQPSLTGVTAVYLNAPLEFFPEGFQAKFAVVRMLGVGSVAPPDDALVTQIRLADTTELRNLYLANGGNAGDSIAVTDVDVFDARSKRCEGSCAWGVGVAVPLFATAVLMIPVFMSLVYMESSRSGPEFFLVATQEEEPDEFAQCEDWGPVELLEKVVKTEEKPVYLDGAILVQEVENVEL